MGNIPLLPEEQAVYDYLDSHSIPYSALQHPAAFTMEECLAVEEKLGVHIPKNLFLCNRQKTDFYLLMMPGDKPFKTKRLTKQLGCARLSFADEQDMWNLLRIHPGAVSPMGLINDSENRVRLLIDSELMSLPAIGCHPCVNTATVRLEMPAFLTSFVPSTGNPCTEIFLPREDVEK